MTAKGLGKKLGSLFNLPEEGVPATRATRGWGGDWAQMAIPIYGTMGQVLKR